MKRVTTRLRALKNRLLKRTQRPAILLNRTPELSALQLVSDVAASAREGVPKPGVISRFVDSIHFEEDDLKLKLVGRTAGVSPPPWHDGSGGAPAHGVNLGIVREALHTPEYGAVILEDGGVLHATIAEALYLTPTLAALPFVEMTQEGAALTPPRRLARLERCSIFVPWGARFNYGHFLLDGLSALAALQESHLLQRYPPISPPLNTWQSDLLSLMMGDDHGVREIAAPLIKVHELAFATPMDHFLHAPNAPLEKVRERILSRAPVKADSPKRIYLSRRADEKRKMVNELELEAALELRGFTVVDAAAMSVRDQVTLFRGAEVIAGATGAAFANCLFCPPGAKIFEIQPINYMGIWTRGLCHFVGLDWHGYFAASPLEETDVYLEGAHRPGVHFAWRAPLDAFLAFMDERL